MKKILILLILLCVIGYSFIYLKSNNIVLNSSSNIELKSDNNSKKIDEINEKLKVEHEKLETTYKVNTDENMDRKEVYEYILQIDQKRLSEEQKIIVSDFEKTGDESLLPKINEIISEQEKDRKRELANQKETEDKKSTVDVEGILETGTGLINQFFGKD